jgi:hypothetical protein
MNGALGVPFNMSYLRQNLLKWSLDAGSSIIGEYQYHGMSSSVVKT